MQRFAIGGLLFLSALVAGNLFAPAGAAEPKADDSPTPLFSGKNFVGWKIFPSGKAWSIRPNAIVNGHFQPILASEGKPESYIVTDKSYKNYALSYDWQIDGGSAKALKDDSDYDGDCGCLVHLQPPHKLWPKSVEIEGKPKELGKLLFLDCQEVGETNYDLKAKNKALKKKIGEWNTTEVVCKSDGSIVVSLNGAEICSGKSELTEGAIAFKAAGPKIWFANIQLKQLAP